MFSTRGNCRQLRFATRWRRVEHVRFPQEVRVFLRHYLGYRLPPGQVLRFRQRGWKTSRTGLGATSTLSRIFSVDGILNALAAPGRLWLSFGEFLLRLQRLLFYNSH